MYMGKAFVPAGLRLIERDPITIIRYRRTKPHAWFMLFFGGILTLFVTLFDVVLFPAWSRGLAIDLVTLTALASFHIVAFGSLYWSTVLFVNTTEFAMSPEQLQIRPYPLPWWGQQTFTRAEIASFKVRIRLDHECGCFQEVLCVTPYHAECVLLGFIIYSEQAEYIRDCLLDFYGISPNR